MVQYLEVDNIRMKELSRMKIFFNILQVLQHT